MIILFKNNIIARRVTLLLFVALLATPVVAGQHQSHASIRSVAKQFMQKHIASRHQQDGYQQQVTITTGKLDSRLKLKLCEKPLQAFLPKGSRDVGKTTVGVKCTGRKPWSMYLPVRVSMYRNVLIATRQLLRGELLQPADVKLASRDLAELPYGYVDDLPASLGMKLKRRVTAGTALTPTMLKKPQVISRGQRITILADSGRMQVRMAGKALAHGAVGDRIAVQNVSSKQKLEGVITASGEVRVKI
jgi:flagella basal body P-ring formation protein FlgA